jgi:hypothetical protein
MWGDVGMEKGARMRRWRNRNCSTQMKSTWLPKVVFCVISFRKREKKRGKKKTPKGTLMEFGKRPKVDQRDINILVP